MVGNGSRKRWAGRWKPWACVMLCLSVCGVASATEFHGQVVIGGVPVPGAVVTLTQGDKVVTAVSDAQGIYEFPDIADGAWKIEIKMRGFAPLHDELTVAPNAPQVAWEMKLLSLGEILAQAQPVAPPPPAAVLLARPSEPAKKAASDKPADAKTPQAPAEDSERPSDGLLINGSVNNAATSPFTLPPAFGNRRAGSKSLYTGGLGVIVDNAVFDARPYSLTGQRIAKDAYSRVTTLLSVGGPLNIPHLLYHGPTFFVGYQSTRNTSLTNASGLVPTDAERNGDFSGVLDAAGQPVTIYNPATGQPFSGPIPVSPQAQALLALYPHANVAGSSQYNYQTDELSSAHVDALQSRLSKSFGHRDDVYGGFGFQSYRSNYANLFQFVDTQNTLGIDTNVNWSHRFNHQLFATTTYHLTRQRTELRPFFERRENVSGDAGIAAATTVSGATPVLNGGNDQAPAELGPPFLAFSSITELGDANSVYNRNRTDAFTLRGSVTRGRHTLSAGGDLRRQEFNQLAEQNPRGTYSFTGAATSATGAVSGTSGSDLADFLIGVPDASAIAFGNADKYFRQSVYDLYATDDWRVRPELTINAGLRWEYGAPLTELKGRLVNLDTGTNFTTATQVLGTAPVAGYSSSLVNPDKRGFEPRIGISWRPLPASTLVIKAGYGIYDDTSIYLTTAEAMSQQAPLSTSVSVSNGPTCPLSLAAGFKNCTGTTPDNFAVDPNLRVGYAQAWQLSAQRDLPAALVITATYQGIKGTRGLQEFLPNTCPPLAPSPCTANPVGYVYRTSNGDSTREAGILQLRRRLRSGFTATLQYTWSKAIDDDASIGGAGHVSATAAGSASSSSAEGSAPTPTIAQDWTNLRGERGLSSFDQRNILTASLQYTSGMGLGGGMLMTGWRGRLLKEWTVSTQINAASGLPETPIYFVAVANTGVTGTVRPNATGAPIRQAKGGVFLNAAAYTAPAAGQWGNARRDSIPGPDQFSLNGSVARTFRLHDPFNLDVRVDGSNLLNHAVFTAWNNITNGSTFGEPTAVNAMRSLQITGRLRF